MSSQKEKTKTTKKLPQCAMSNVFAMFDQSQIQEFKEAFNMIDQNRDGFIDKEDLHDMLASLGKNPTDAYLDAMMNEAPGPINFTMFLTMFGEKLNGTDPEDVIRNAFACFDEEATGTIQEDYLRELLTTMGAASQMRKWMSCTGRPPSTKRGISTTSSSHASSSMEQKTKMTEELQLTFLLSFLIHFMSQTRTPIGPTVCHLVPQTSPPIGPTVYHLVSQTAPPPNPLRTYCGPLSFTAFPLF